MDLIARTCPCGESYDCRPGSKRKWCRPNCPDRTRRYRKDEAVSATHSCECCGDDFTKPHRRRSKWCDPCSTQSASGSKCRKCEPFEVLACGVCGDTFAREWARGVKPKYCAACRSLHRWDSREVPDVVLAIVRERATNVDGVMVCQICKCDKTPVDPDAPARSAWLLSYDHIAPRSQDEGGFRLHDPDNLRVAHLWCNASLRDGSFYTESDFEVVA